MNGGGIGIEEGICGIGWDNSHLRTHGLSLRFPHNKNLLRGVRESDNDELYWTMSMVMNIPLMLTG